MSNALLFALGRGRQVCQAFLDILNPLRNRRRRLARHARGRLALEALESRLAPAWLQIVQTPAFALSGDARKGTTYSDYSDYSGGGGYNDPYHELFGIQQPEDSDGAGSNGSVNTAVYAQNMAAGFGTFRMQPRWETSNGSFAVSGALQFKVNPSPGDSTGDPVQITLNYSFDASGGTGAKVGNPGGETYLDYSATAQVVGGPGGSSTLFSGSKTAKLINSSPTGEIVDFTVRENHSWVVTTTVGATVSISLFIHGASADWQGGYTGLPRGAVYADFSFNAQADTPDVKASYLTEDTVNRTINFGYNVSGVVTTPLQIEFYWASDKSGGGVVTSALPNVLLGDNTTGYHELPPIPIDQFLTQHIPTYDQYLIAVLDPYNKIKEHYADHHNVASLDIYQKPLVSLSIPDTLQKGESYSVWVTITNRSLVADQFNIVLKTTPPANPATGYVHSGPLVVRVQQEIPALQQDAFPLTTATDTWQWLQGQPPLLKTITDGISSKSLTEMAKSILKFFGLDSIKNAVSVYSLADKIYALIDNQSPITEGDLTQTVNFQLSVTSSAFGTADDQAIRVVRVSPVRVAAFHDFVARWNIATFEFKLALSALVFAPQVGAAFLPATINMYTDALTAYAQAIDPPDPNYQVIPTPQPIDDTLLQGVAAGPLRNLLQASLQVSALTDAADTARNRADGAQAAGDWTWVDRQLGAAAQYDTQAAFAETSVAELENLLQGDLSSADGGITQDMLNQIAANGLPGQVVSALQGAGLTADDIAQVQQVLIQQGPTQPQEGSAADFTVVSSLLAANEALGDLQREVQVRTEILGEATSYLSPDDITALHQSLQQLSTGVAAGIPSQPLFASIQDFVGLVENDLHSTNDVIDLEPILDSALLSLIQFQALDASAGGLAQKVSQLATSGSVDSATASALTGTLTSVDTALAAGQFDQAALDVQSVLTQVESAWGGSIAYDGAVQLHAYAATLADLLASGSLQPGPVAVADAVTLSTGQSVSIDVLANDSNPVGQGVSIAYISKPAHGSAVVDPNDPTGASILYTAVATFTGNDSFEYTIRGPGSIHLSNTTVTVSQALVAGTAYNWPVPASGQNSFVFAGTAGQELYYNALANEYAPVYLQIVGPNGSQIASIYAGADAGPYVLSTTGSYQFIFDNSGSNAAAAVFQLLDAAAQPVLTRNQPTSGTLSVSNAPSNPTDVSQVYQLTATAGERLVFQNLSVSALQSATWALYDPTGKQVAGGGYLEQDFALSIATSGQYLLVLNGTKAQSVSYSFEVRPAVVNVAPLQLGAVMTGSIDTEGGQQVYTFTGTAGQRIFLDPIGTNLPNGGVSIVDPSGVTILSRYLYVGNNGVVTLAADGTYQVVVQDRQTGTGTFDLRVMDVATIPAVDPGQTMSGTLTPTADGLGDVTAVYRVPATAGQVLSFASQSGQDSHQSSYWVVQGPNNEYIPGGSAPIDQSMLITADSNGDFLLELNCPTVVPLPYQFVVTLNPQPLTGSFTIGDAVTGSIAVPGQPVVYTFTGTAGQFLHFETQTPSANPLVVQIWSPGGQEIFFGPIYDNQALVLPDSGTYQLTVAGQDAATGNFAFRLADVSGAPPVDVGQVVTGTIAAPSGSTYYILAGTAGERVLVHNASGGYPSGMWTLYGPDGANVSKLTSLSSDFVATLPVTGTYLLALDSFAQQPLDYSFEITNPNIETSGVQLGQLITGRIAAPGAEHIYTFSGVAGQALVYSGLDGSSDNTTMQLTAPDGTVLAFAQAKTAMGVLTLPATGTYQLTLAATATNVGSYAFRLIDVATQPELPLNTYVQAEAVTAPGVSQPTAQAVIYRVAGAAGETLIYDRQANFHLGSSFTWSLYDPNGQVVPLSDYYGPANSSSSDFDQNVSLPATGEYTIVIQPDDSSGVIHFELSNGTQPSLTLTQVTDPLTQANVASAALVGTTSAGAAVHLVATDGFHTTAGVDTTADDTGAWSETLDVSGLIDGPVTYLVTAMDSTGATAAVRWQTSKMTVTPLAITRADAITADHPACTVAGTALPWTWVTLKATDGVETDGQWTVQADATGAWTVTVNVGNLADGVVLFKASVTDDSGNTTAVETEVTKSTGQPGGGTLAALILTQAPNPVTASAQAGVTVAGTAASGATISVLATDGTTTTAPATATADANGGWSVALDVRSLRDGTITYAVTATEDDGNTTTLHQQALKDTVARLTVTATTDPLLQSDDADATVLGTAWAGSSVSVAATDGTTTTAPTTVTADSTGAWFANLDTRGLSDGPITFEVQATDSAGNTTSAQVQVVKATVLPTITTQPQDQTVAAGQTATFTAAATGPGLSVQWQESFGGVSFYAVPGATSTSFQVQANPSLSGLQVRAVFTNTAGSVTTNPATLSVTQPQLPTITGITPASGPVAGGTSVTIQGSGFTDATAVTFGNTPATAFVVNSDSQINAVSPAGTSGIVDVTVITPEGTSALSSRDQFLYVAPPRSSVFSLPSNSPASFTVSWSGQDYSGTGIASYSIYVSDNGAAFTPLLVNTTQTSVTFTGQDGHSYGFYSVATDNTGNTQATPTSAQATTTVDAVPPSSNVAALPNASPGTFTLNWSGSDDRGGSGLASYTIFVSDNGGSFHAIPSLTNTTQTSASFTGLTGHSYGFFSIASDNVGNVQATPTSAQATTQVDAVAPTSRVSLLPIFSPASFTVSWSGQDNPGGSGIASYGIYVSDNGAGFQLWQTSTASASALFKGLINHTYAFYSIATDNVTNAQPTPANAQATTMTVPPPSVTIQPASQTAFAGTIVTFLAAASGTPTPTVQWMLSTDGGHSFSNIPGATTASYTFTAAAAQSGNEYQAVFTNAGGSITTNAATLTINPALAILTNPAPQTVAIGQKATFTAKASGTPSPTVQWQVSGDGGQTFSNIPGATATTFSFTTTAAQNSNLYRAVFSNKAGQAPTIAVPLTLNFTLQVARQPQTLTVAAGTPITLTAASLGSSGATVLWQVRTPKDKTFTNIPGATALSLAFTPQQTDSGNLYQAVFSKPTGTKTATVTLTVDAPPTITAGPANQTVAAGTSQKAIFTASASGTPMPSVQWQVSSDGGLTFSNLAGATATKLTLSYLTATQDGNCYRAVWSNPVGQPCTSAAVLTVTYAPIITLQPAAQTVIDGHPATFTAGAKADPQATVKWQSSSDKGKIYTDVPGATSTSCTFLAQGSDSGELYRAVFSNSSGTTMTRAVALTVNVPPAITAGPISQTVIVGQKATFTATASGSPTPTVQWQVSGDGGVTFSNISGATSTRLTVTATAVTNGHQYRAVFTNSAGQVATAAATLTVNFTLQVASQPQTLTVAPGVPVALVAASLGSPQATVQWQVSIDKGKPFTDIPGATSLTLSFVSQLSENGEVKRAVFSKPAGTKTATVTLIVDAPPTVTAGPLSQSVAVGQPATFTATASGTSAFTVQWQVSTDGGLTFTDIAGATSTKLILSKVGLAQSGNQYADFRSNSSCLFATQFLWPTRELFPFLPVSAPPGMSLP